MRFLVVVAIIATAVCPGYSIPKCSGYWTRYYDRDDPSGTGDYETLHDLRKQYPGRICAKPLGFVVKLVHPLPGETYDYWDIGGNYIDIPKDFSKEVGFICRNDYQKKKGKPPCKDYKISFCCPIEVPYCPSDQAEWTNWYDRDNPSVTGDYELLKDIRKENPGKVCPYPLAIHAQLVDGRPWQAGHDDKIHISKDVGLYCKKKEQHDNTCEDYRVRFCCRKRYPKPKCGGYWTRYYDRDDPSATGDYETLHDLRKKYPGRICAHPTALAVKLVHPIPYERDDYWDLGGNYIDIPKDFSTKVGFICRNAYQKKKGYPPCKDYKISFCCPNEVPSCSSDKAEWTGWYDRDDPSVTGDYETLKDIRKENPGKVCPYPLAIHAQLVDGRPWQAGHDDKIHISKDVGLYCKKKEQHDNTCEDYRVRFCCRKPYWTPWMNVDKPSGTGDYETLKLLRKKYRFCSNPSKIQAAVADKRNPPFPAEKTGQSFKYYNVKYGFLCLNHMQRRSYDPYRPYSGTQGCLDYKVRLYCP